MAMRRRRFGRRFGRKPVMREQLLWASNLFEEVSLGDGGTIVENALFDPSQEAEGAGNTGAAGGHIASVRRIIFTGGVVFSPQSTALEFDVNAVWAAIYVIDREDTDGDLTGTAQGSILEGGVDRLLWTKCSAFGNTEQASTLSHTNYRPPLMDIDVDLKVRVNMKMDSLLVLGLQLSNAVTSSMSDLRLFGLSRVLLRKNW